MQNCKKRHFRGDTCQSTCTCLPCISEAKVLFLMFRLVAMVDLKQQRSGVWACLETIKTNQLERLLSKLIYTRFLQVGRLYFNHDIFSCAMMLLIIFLSKTRIKFIYVHITYVYVTEFTLTEPM